MLRILPRYFLRELLKTFTYVFVAVLLIVFVGFALQMVYQGVNIIKLPRIFPYLLLLSFPYSLPVALLAAAIMTYGRFSGDNEILAIRSSGIHLQGIVTPTILLGTLCSIFTLVVNGNLLPATEAKIEKLKRDAIHMLLEQLGLSNPTFSFPGWEMFVGSKEGEIIKDVLVIKSPDTEVVTEVLKGRTGTLKRDPATGVYQMELKDVVSARFTDDIGEVKWMKCDEGVVPIPLGRRVIGGEERIRSLGIFTLFKERKRLALEVQKHTQKHREPLKEATRLYIEREKIERDMGTLVQDILRRSLLAARLEGEVKATRQNVAASVHQTEELEGKLKQQQARLDQIERQTATSAADKEKKERELQEVKASIPPPAEDAKPAGEPGKASDKPATEGGEAGAQATGAEGAVAPGQAPSTAAGGATETPAAPVPPPVPPEYQEKMDSLTREIEKLASDLKRLKDEAAEVAALITATQRDIKDVKEVTKELTRFAEERAKLRVTTLDEITAATEQQKKQAGILAEKKRLSQEAQDQQKLHEVTCVLQERLALAFASLAFVLIAIPLGIMCKHGHILVGFSVGIGLLLVYYAVFITGQILAEGRYFWTTPSYWGANACMGGTGLVLLLRLFQR